MKAFFTGHWEKFVAASGLLLLAASLLMNLPLGGKPQLAVDSNALADSLLKLESEAVPEVLPVPETVQAVAMWSAVSAVGMTFASRKRWSERSKR